MQKMIAIVSLVIVLALVNWSIYNKEKHLAEGQVVYLELASVESRSLMQADHMALRFRLADAVYQVLSKTKAYRKGRHGVAASDGFVIVCLDERNIGTIKSLYSGQPLSENELLLRFRVRRGVVLFATDAYYFQEGQGEYYQPAEYGQFRVDKKGELLLVAMCDNNLNILKPSRNGDMIR